MLSIGEFSKICMVSSKTLRYYDEIGLIKPTCIGDNGYRYYAVSQLRTMLLINRLKRYGFSLEEIADLLKDQSGLQDALTSQRNILLSRNREMERIIAEISADLTNLINGEEIMAHIETLNVTLVQMPAITILSSRQHMSVSEYGKYFGMLYARIAQEKLTVAGLPIALYHDEEFSYDNNDTEICVPIKESVAGTRELPAAECAMALHKAPYDKLYETYARIQEWIDQNGYVIAGASREYYVDENEAAPIVEVYCPVKKVK